MDSGDDLVTLDPPYVRCMAAGKVSDRARLSL
jgi:hypothetical protein